MTDVRAAAKRIEQIYLDADGPKLYSAVLTIESILREVVAEEHRKIAATQAVIHGESVMLNGKLVTNEELYKQPTDYIKEARSEMREEAAKCVEDLERGSNLFSRIAARIRALKS